MSDRKTSQMLLYTASVSKNEYSETKLEKSLEISKCGSSYSEEIKWYRAGNNTDH